LEELEEDEVWLDRVPAPRQSWKVKIKIKISCLLGLENHTWS
jgi:hypothetical protein